MDELHCWKYVSRVLNRKLGWLERFENHMQKVVIRSSGKRSDYCKKTTSNIRKGLILSLEEIPTFIDCEVKEKIEDINQRCTRTTFLYLS